MGASENNLDYDRLKKILPPNLWRNRGEPDACQRKIWEGFWRRPVWLSAGDKLGRKAKTKGVTRWDYALFNLMVPKRGFEPRRGSPHWTLNPARLPVPPLRPDAGDSLKRFALAISELDIYNFRVNIVKAKLREATR